MVKWKTLSRNMKQLNKVQTAIFLLGALLMVIGAGTIPSVP